MIEKKDVERILIDNWKKMGMDVPRNHEAIVEYCYVDVSTAADPENWNVLDVIIAFRRWIEEQINNDDPYYCDSCGELIEESDLYCRNCGDENY